MDEKIEIDQPHLVGGSFSCEIDLSRTNSMGFDLRDTNVTHVFRGNHINYTNNLLNI